MLKKYGKRAFLSYLVYEVGGAVLFYSGVGAWLLS